LKRLQDVQLDESASIGYTLKCAAAAFIILKKAKSYEEGIMQLVKEAGDADTNAAVAGALLGAKFGYKNLPAQWVRELIHEAWLQEKVEAFYRAIVEDRKSK